MPGGRLYLEVHLQSLCRIEVQGDVAGSPLPPGSGEPRSLGSYGLCPSGKEKISHFRLVWGSAVLTCRPAPVARIRGIIPQSSLSRCIVQGQGRRCPRGGWHASLRDLSISPSGARISWAFPDGHSRVPASPLLQARQATCLGLNSAIPVHTCRVGTALPPVARRGRGAQCGRGEPRSHSPWELCTPG